MNKKKIGDTWKAFLDVLIEEDANSILDYYHSGYDLTFEIAMKVIQKTLKEHGIFETGE